MKSSPAASASLASARQSGQLADQRSGTLVAERPDEQLAPNSPILSAWPLYMATRFAMDALRASTACSPGCFNHHRRDGGGDQARRIAANSANLPHKKMAHRTLCRWAITGWLELLLFWAVALHVHSFVAAPRFTSHLARVTPRLMSHL